MLRLHYLEGMTIRRLAIFFGTPRSTVDRRLRRAREQILSETHRLLKEKLRLGRPELAALFGFIESRLDVSIRSCLEDGP
jgi:RNA polymerase sigma-70 factor (ECF subfamily)